jgi:cytochrome c oxidase cbb3-type subunit III
MRTPILLAILALSAAALVAQTAGAKRDAGGFPTPTEQLERGRAVYVLSSCHFCHGIDLTGAAMGAADLMNVPLVGRDEGGNLIGPVVRKGLPNLQTSMPQYSDYTDQQISDLAAYIHYLRQQGRYRALSSLHDEGLGNAVAGREYFNGAAKCSSCHALDNDLKGIATKYDDARLRLRLLRPGPDNAVTGNSVSAGLTAHLKLLEIYSDADVRNLLTFLKTAPR